MKRKFVSRDLSNNSDKILSKWDEAISEAKQRIAALKRSIRTFESLRDNGMEFPEPHKQQSRKSKPNAEPTEP